MSENVRRVKRLSKLTKSRIRRRRLSLSGTTKRSVRI